MARSSAAGRKRGKKGGRSVWFYILLFAPAGLVVLPTTMLFLIGMIPTMVAFVIDRDPDKTAPMTVGGLNFCGVMPFAILLWKTGHTIPAALKTLSDPLAWMIMYGAAAVGWALYYGIPPAVASAEVMRSESRIDALKQQKVKLVQEWGPAVAALDEGEFGGEGEEGDGGQE